MGLLVAFMMMPVMSFSRDSMSFSSKAIEVVNITNGSDVVVEMSYNLTLGGTPKPQARPRLGRNGFVYAPGKKDMAALKAKIKGGINNIPIFGSNQPVVVNIKFFMRRPNTHFKGKDRRNALRAGMPLAHVAVPDLDNVVKCVLDGMNELVYQDDKQVAKLVACKLFDSEGDCNGRTVVKVTKFNEE